MTNSLVTAAFTAYNAEATIVPALLSAVSQDWPALEILVIDDASTDGTVSTVEAVIRDYDQATRPIRLLRQARNGGVARARNRLLEEARGEFVAFFDDDDISAPDRVSRQHARIREADTALGHDLVLCHTAREQVFPDGSTRYERTMGCEDEPIPFGNAVADRILFGRLSAGVVGSCATCSQMARRSVYERVGAFDPALLRSEDTDLNIRGALLGAAFVGLAAPLVRQTMTEGAEKNLAAEFDAYATLQDKHRDYLADRGWLDFCLEWRAIRRFYMERRTGRLILRALHLAFQDPVKLVKKLYWSLPARETRRYQREWQNAAVRRSMSSLRSL